jgi:NAD(P)H-hydrate epimerase
MRPLSREETRRIDSYAVSALGVPGVVLMENAGRNAADAIERFLGGAAGRKVAVVAGAGNNGGDGFVVARHLAMRGASVVTFIAAPVERIAGDAKVNLQVLQELGHDIRHAASTGKLGSLSKGLSKFDLIVDAVGGTGIQGTLRGEAAAAVGQINAANRPVVAIDIPTGLDCDTGEAPGPTVKAAMTVTFVARKKGFDSPGAAAYTGQVVVADIGIPADVAIRLQGEKV